MFHACENAFALIYWLQAMQDVDDDVPEEVD